MKKQKRWVVASGDAAAEKSLAADLGVHPLIARLLVNRGITTAGQAGPYLDAPLDGLEDPFKMASMPEAVDRIIRAKQAGETVAVYGDYDVDGMTATAALLRFFGELGVRTSYHIPDRAAEGYGVNKNALQALRTDGAGLVITVDTGADAVEEVAFANSIGLDAIITDHHRMDGPAPPALAVLNPTRPGCPYPFKSLCGASIAFKLMTAVRGELHRRGTPRERLPNLRRYLDLVALGVVADVAPLTGENRTMTRHGLEELTATARPGLAALKRTAGIGKGVVSCGDVGFRLAPRLNSAGRLGRADKGLELLITDDRRTAGRIAAWLEETNARRREIQDRVFKEATAMVRDREGRSGDRAIVLASDDWHPGVTGIVAAKLVDAYHLPAALVSFDGDKGKGSARSIPALDLFRTISACRETLDEYGGHRAAAGFSVRRGRFEAFREMFLGVAFEALNEDDVIPELKIDGEADPRDMDIGFANELSSLEPFGQGAPPPVFVSRGVLFFDPPFYMGAGGEHVRLSPRNGAEGVQAVGFHMAEFFRTADLRRDEFDIVYTPEKNVWREMERVQLRLLDIRRS